MAQTKHRMTVGIALTAASLALGSPGAQAQEASARGPAPAPVTIAGWDKLVSNLHDLPAKLLAKLPPELRSDPQIQQEVGRLALSALASSAITALGGDGDHPVFLPGPGNVVTVGQPNADTAYRTARITPGGSYRLRGTRGSLRMVRIAQSGPPPAKTAGAPPTLGFQRVDHDLNALRIDARGQYDVLLSPTRPEGYQGDWWELKPNTNNLLLRIVNTDWGRGVEPTFSIERLDMPVERARPNAARLEASLGQLAAATNFIAPLLIDRVEQLRQQGYTNKLKAADLSNMGGLAGQFYYEGAYTLKDDEALIVESPVPAKCLYRSIILTNDIYETTDWYNNHSSLNDTQAQPDKDGVLRFVVSARDPGVPNWLDTAGYARGAIQGRWTECDSQPVPTVRKVAFAQVRQSLPKETGVVTPAQRQAIIRARRAALQHRPLW